MGPIDRALTARLCCNDFATWNNFYYAALQEYSVHAAIIPIKGGMQKLDACISTGLIGIGTIAIKDYDGCVLL